MDDTLRGSEVDYMALDLYEHNANAYMVACEMMD